MRLVLSVLCSLVVAATSLAQSTAAPSTMALFAVDQPTAAQWTQIHQLFDVVGTNSTAASTARLEFLVDDSQKALLLTVAPNAQWVADSQPFANVYAGMVAALGVDVPPAAYYTVAEIEAAIDAQVALYPGLAQKVNLSTLPGGQLTHEGRAIYALKVSANVAVDEDEPAILIAAQHHARELNGPHMVIGAMGRLLAGYATDPQLQAVVDGYEVYFVPMVNPDGVNHVWTVTDFWRKNRRNNGPNFGVDINRNFPFLWGVCGSSTNSGSGIYRGPAPASEPETVTMSNLVKRLRPEFYLDFHSSGREVLRTYAPCANVSASIAGLIEYYVDSLRNPMGYAKRNPSASGEAPEDHWSHGTLSFLIEVGTSFQPAFSVTVAEEAVAWPGVEYAMTTFRPAVRGHVRSALGSAPLEATITYSPNVFSHGEVCESRLRDGRYGLWLPLGTWDVHYAAPGHQTRTLSVTVSNYDQPIVLDLILETSAGMPTVTKVGAGQIGTMVTYTYTSPGDFGKQAFFGWCLDTSPGIDLGDLRIIPMNNDFLMQAAWVGNPFLAPTWGTLNGADQAQAVLLIPNEAWLIGLTTYVGGMTFDPLYQSGIKTWSQAVPVTIIP